MTDAEVDPIESAINNAIAQHAGVENPLVTSWVLVAGFVDGNGERAVYTDTAEGQRCHETLGLLAFGTANETRRAVTGEDGS